MSDMTPGDPLSRPPGSTPPERPVVGAPGSTPPERPVVGAPGYTSPAPPGAGGPGAVAPDSLGGPPLGGLRLASWGSRALATIIDAVIVSVGAIALLVVFGSVFSIGFFGGDTAGFVAIAVGLLLYVVAVSIVALAYAPAMMARTNGQTLGRMATGIRVVRTNGLPMDFSWAMLREVAVKALLFNGVGLALTGGLAGLLDVLWPLWDEENRALHDFVVQTRTVKVE